MITICMFDLLIYFIKKIFKFSLRNQTPPTTPQRVRSAAQQNERDSRVLESPEHHRTPHHVRMARLSSVPPIPPPVFMPAVPPPAPIFRNLPPELAQQYAALPPLYPMRQRSVVPAPAPAPVLAHYPNLPLDLTWRVAALPPILEQGRGRGRSRGNNIAAQYAALPLVCFILYYILRKADFCTYF